MSDSLHTLDYTVIILYFAAIVACGIYFGRYTKSTADFFFGGQRFAWWLIAASCIATLVGSYSFINYSDLGYDSGLASMTYYTNDWFIMPLFLLGWFPIIYFNRISTIPEYFERRFDRRTRYMVLILIMLYLVGYIGMNLQTIAVVLNRVVGMPVMVGAVIVAIISLAYMHSGGQMSVLMTDLFQSIILLVAGIGIFLLGIHHVGGWDAFWNGLPATHKVPFPKFNEPANFHFIGTFWGDALSGTVAFFFINQGIILRFLSVKSVHDGRKAMIVMVLVLMPVAAIVVSNGGWVGKAMATSGWPEAPEKAKSVFVMVMQVITQPGVFGLVIAALLAALMSTLDTLINAVSAVGVNDIWKAIVPDKDDKYYLHAARLAAVGATLLGVVLVPIFELDDQIYTAHSKFFTTILPSLIVVLLMGVLWSRFTPAAAFWALLIGSLLTLVTHHKALYFLIKPLAHGVPPDKGYIYMRGLFGTLVTVVLGVGITLFTKPRPKADLSGLCIATLSEGMRLFKGGEPNRSEPKTSSPLQFRTDAVDADRARLPVELMDELSIQEGDLIYVSDARRWLGGLRSVHLKADVPHQEAGVVILNDEAVDRANFSLELPVTVEKIL